MDFLDIGHNVKIRLEPYRILLSDLDPAELDLLAYRLHATGLKGEIVQGTALRQITFPSNRYGQWHVAYLVIPQMPRREIFIISISPTKLSLADEQQELEKINEKIKSIAFAAIRIVIRLL